jgi:epoxyqueuosine reductase
MTNLKEQIIAISKEIGISKIGFTAADNFDWKNQRLAQEKDKLRF